MYYYKILQRSSCNSSVSAVLRQWHVANLNLKYGRSRFSICTFFRLQDLHRHLQSLRKKSSIYLAGQSTNLVCDIMSPIRVWNCAQRAAFVDADILLLAFPSGARCRLHVRLQSRQFLTSMRAATSTNTSQTHILGSSDVGGSNPRPLYAQIPR